MDWKDFISHYPGSLMIVSTYHCNVKISAISNNFRMVMRMMVMCCMWRSMTLVWLRRRSCGCSCGCSSGRSCRWGRWRRSHCCCRDRACWRPLAISLLRITTLGMDVWCRWTCQWRWARSWIPCSTSAICRRYSITNTRAAAHASRSIWGTS